MNTSKLTIVVNIHANPGSAALVSAELQNLIAPTRRETGSITYDFHLDREDPHHFMFYETWKNRDLWQNHMHNPNLTAYMKATEGHVKQFTLNEMSNIDSVKTE